MRLIKKRINQSNQKDVITILGNTISELKQYLKDLEDGKIYDTSKFVIGSDQYYNETQQLAREIDSVMISINNLQSTLNKVEANKTACEVFRNNVSHYN